MNSTMCNSNINLESSELRNSTPVIPRLAPESQPLLENQSMSVPKLMRASSVSNSLPTETDQQPKRTPYKALTHHGNHLVRNEASPLRVVSENIQARRGHSEEKPPLGLMRGSWALSSERNSIKNDISDRKESLRMGRAMSSQGERRGSASNSVVKKKDELADVRESFLAFQAKTQNYFYKSQRETRRLDRKISKVKREAEKSYNKIEKASQSTLEVDMEKKIKYANLREFKKEIVNKMVDSIEEKGEIMYVIQAKRLRDQIVKEELKALG